MNTHTHTVIKGLFALGLYLGIVSSSIATIQMTKDGIKFPDGSEQVKAMPDPSGNNKKVLTSNGTSAEWKPGGGSSLPAKSMDVFSVAGTYTWDWVAAGKPNVVYVSMIGGGQGGYAQGVSAATNFPGQWGEIMLRQPVNVSADMSVSVGGGGVGFTRWQSQAQAQNQGGQTSFGNLSVAGGNTIGSWCDIVVFSGWLLAERTAGCVVTCPTCRGYTIINGRKYAFKNTFFGNSGQGGAGSWGGGEEGQSGWVTVEW